MFRHFLLALVLNPNPGHCQSAFVSGFIESVGVSSSIGQLVTSQIILGTTSIQHGVQIPLNADLSVKDFRTVKPFIYPNPSLGELRVVGLDSEEADLLFYDLTGVLVLKTRMAVEKVFTVKLDSGMYFVSIFAKNGQLKAVQKIIITK